MLSIRKILRSKLRSSFVKEGRHEKDKANSSRFRTVINEEYMEAFRTKSFIDICDKIQNQLEARISLEDANPLSSSSSSPPPSPPSDHIHPSEYLVEPRHKTLVSISENSNHHHFLTNYLDTSLEAGRICEFILHTIHQARVDYHTIRDMIEGKPDDNWLYKNLASLAQNGNPFAEMTPEKFHDLHESHQRFLQQLTSKCAKMKRQKKFTRFIKRSLMSLSCLALFQKKRLNREKRETKRREEEARMDAAARGIYILINDFDTMSILVKRVHDEMEHRKFTAGVCVRIGKKEALKKVVREFQMHEFVFLEQLEELEMQIYVCFLNIDRSMRPLIQ